MKTKEDEVIEWLTESTDRFLIIWDANVRRTHIDLYRRIRRRVRLPLRANKSGMIFRQIDGEKTTVGAIIDINFMYFIEPKDGFCLYTTPRMTAKYAELIKHVEDKGISVKVVYK